MGESPQERAAREFRGAQLQLAQRYIGGDLSGEERFRSSIDPLLASALSSLRALSAARIGALQQNVGEQLVTSGAAPGEVRSSAYLSALAPVVAETLGQESAIHRLRASSLADLIKMSSTLGLQHSGLEFSGISQMKDTTTAGDILGAASTIAAIVAALSGNPSLLSLLLGGVDTGSRPKYNQYGVQSGLPTA